MKQTFTLLSSLAFSLFSFAQINAQAVNEADSLALIDLYNATNGNSWTNHDNWLTPSPLCTWHGITTSSHRVVRIDLGVNNLAGTLPSSFGNLTNLQSLYLYNNKLTGSLPASLSKLLNLKELLLSNNQFSGAIPSSIGKLIALEQLDLANNQFGKSIPLSIGSLVNVQYLNLNNNQLSGSIPTSIGKLINVHILEMADNQLTGSIPSTIGNLTMLLYLYLQNNQLSGNVPAAIGKLQNLQVLYADNNRLSGSLTRDISNAVNLQLLSLHHNQLTGVIPSSLGTMTNLTQLYLNSNELHGTIPVSLLSLTNLQYLYLDHNHLTQSSNRNPVLPPNVSLHADISYNDFTFDGMEFIATHYPFVTYGPQSALSIHKNGESISLYAGGTLKNNDYAWFRSEDGTLVTIHGDSSFRPVAGGHYYAKVRNVMAPELLLETDTFEYIEPAPVDKTATSITAIDDDKAFLVYPNPAHDIVHIRTEGKSVIAIMDGNGKLILTKTVSGNDVIDVSRFAAGTYYLLNRTTSGMKKLMVVR